MTPKKNDKTADEARRLLASPDLFRQHLDALKRNELVGEERYANVVYVTGVSRLLQRPLNLTAKGQSSTGKNHVIDQVLSLFPKDSVREITSTSAHAWNYSEDDFRHRVLYQQEIDQKSAAIRQVRQWISQGRLIRTTTVRSNGEFKTKRFVAEGPIAAISTTTRNRLEIDDETRHISIWTDESRQQTRRILEAAFRQSEPLSRHERRVWRKTHSLLEARASSSSIVFPSWVSAISDAAYDQNIRMRRYLVAFATACETVALIRSFLPGHYDERKRRISVHFSDFAVTALLFAPVFEESLHRGTEKVDRTREIVEHLVASKKGKAVGWRDIAAELQVSKDKAYRLLRDASAAGVICRCNKPEKGNSKLYRPTARPRFIPDPEELFHKLPQVGTTVKFVHPLTGKWVVYKRKKD